MPGVSAPAPEIKKPPEGGEGGTHIFRLITVEGYGTNKVASQLNLRGIKTKRGTTLWRGTSIRAIISNPIYKGVLRFGEELSRL